MASTDVFDLRERALTEADILETRTLVAEAGWNQVDADWALMLEQGRGFGIFGTDGRLIATAVVLPFGGRFAWISMVLVEKAHRRLGLATRLMRRCIDAVLADGLVPLLDATPDGRQVYIRLGFRDLWGYRRMASRQLSTSEPKVNKRAFTVRRLVDSDGPRLLAYDRSVFGADRSMVLSNLRHRLPDAAVLVETADRIRGFALARDGRNAVQIGPVVADNTEVAIALLTAMSVALSGPVFIDAANHQPDFRQWLEETGFARQRGFMRMIYGATLPFEDRARTFAVAGPELG
jgi:GNAT superfamily N-acetyltransferase